MTLDRFDLAKCLVVGSLVRGRGGRLYAVLDFDIRERFEDMPVSVRPLVLAPGETATPVTMTGSEITGILVDVSAKKRE